ncbi:hypothetical protein C0J52_22415 [Blattella germanica]|nr:hypothetical protein C0J52_22415 [Blattella germanica]
MPHTCSAITSIFMRSTSAICVPIYRHTNNQKVTASTKSSTGYIHDKYRIKKAIQLTMICWNLMVSRYSTLKM